jgi:hypothetical protein
MVLSWKNAENSKVKNTAKKKPPSLAVSWVSAGCSLAAYVHRPLLNRLEAGSQK